MYECQFVNRSGARLSLRSNYLEFANLIHLMQTSISVQRIMVGVPSSALT